MGLSQSCLGRSAHVEEFQAPDKAGAPGRHDHTVAEAKPSAAAGAGLNAHNTSANCDRACNPKSGRESAACPTNAPAGHHHGGVAAVLGLSSHDAVLETDQLSGVFTATAASPSLQSTYLSSEGFPHSAWELGPPSTDNEQTRVQALRALDILDSVSQGRRAKMDEEANMVLGALMHMFDAITAMLVLFDDTRIIIRNSLGFMRPGEFPYRWSFCAYTLTKHRPQTLVVPDATKDIRFADNPFVRGAPHIRFYCGAPLVSASGHILGTLCFADSKPRPGFDVSQCYVMNNLAELMVRQLERYRAHAGPAGPVDAEATALARVARTIECYDAITGLVDISLADGWMLMYVNEAWEALCAPWARKQMVGKPLQQLLVPEEGDEGGEGKELERMHLEQEGEGGEQQQQWERECGPGMAAAVVLSSPGADGGGVMRASTAVGVVSQQDKLLDMLGLPQKAASSRTMRIKGAAAEHQAAAVGGGRSCSGTSITCVSHRASVTGGVSRRGSAGDGGDSATGSEMGSHSGIVMDGAEMAAIAAEAEPAAAGGGARLVALTGAERRQWRRRLEGGPRHEAAWRRHEAALRAGEEVELRRARVMLADGRPSSTVVRVSVRSANCHVLDAAVRMPVGVPHELGLPTSVLAAAGDDTRAAVGGAAAAAAAEALAGPESDKPASFYCIITLTRIEPRADSEEEVGAEGAGGEVMEVCQARGLRGDASPPLSDRPQPQVLPAAPSGSSVHAADRPSPAWRSSAIWCGPPTCLRPSLDCGGGSAGGGLHGSGGGGRSRGLSAIVGTSALMTASTRPSVRSSVSPGACNWAYGMEPFPGLKLQHLLGKGGYGRVFAAMYKGQKVAAKVVSNSMLKAATCVNGVTLEALLAQEIEHPYIVRTHKCIVRSYRPDERQSAAFMSTRNSLHIGGSLAAAAAAAEYGIGAGSVSYRGGGAASPIVSALPGGPSSGADVLRAGSRLGPRPSEISETGRASIAAMAPEDWWNAAGTGDGAGPLGGGALPASNPARAAAAVTEMATVVAGASVQPSAPAAHAEVALPLLPPPSGMAVPSAVLQRLTPQAEEYDSFDAVGEAEGGMIDQLTSAAPPVCTPVASQPRAPPAVTSAASHLQPPPPPPSAPPLSALPPHLVAAIACPDRLSVASSGPQAQSHGSILSTANANVDHLVASLAVGRAPPRAPVGPADLCGPSGTVGGVSSVFTTAAAAAAATATEALCRNSSRAGVTAGTAVTAREALPDGETWILQEYCGGGTLQDAIDAGRLRTEPSRLRGQPHLPLILLTAQEIASAMACLHSRGYLHGDLSAVNVLLALNDAPAPGLGLGLAGVDAGSGRGWVAKVSDFGLAKNVPDPTKPYVSSAYGVITHCAPEVLKSHAQTQKADCYSFGVLLWQMYTGSRPWANMSRFQIFGAVTSATSPGLRFLPTQQPPPRYRDLTLRCLSPHPESRPSFAEICEELRIMTYEAAAAGQLS